MIALISAAYAFPMTICFDAVVDYDDVGLGSTEDYFQANTDRPLRGLRVQYKPTAAAFYSAPFARTTRLDQPTTVSPS